MTIPFTQSPPPQQVYFAGEDANEGINLATLRLLTKFVTIQTGAAPETHSGTLPLLK
ncbi:MAG: hypothetical protein KF734_10050 [Saprospiraceae bacterium]|nr:hypothetical protein [Saprospiraceae bacterium]